MQGMSDGAYRGYHNLIMSQWQNEDGMLPNSDKELAKLSGLFARWAKFREEIMENFQENGGRVVNQVQYAEWVKAREISEKKGRRLPECGKTLEDSGESQDRERTHARVSVNVSVPVEVVGEIKDQSLVDGLFSEKELPPKKIPISLCEELYQAYPRHTAKDAALKAIEKALKKKSFDELLPIVRNYAQNVEKDIAEGRTEKQFIPHPATWFNQGRYEDDDLKPPPQFDVVEVTPQEFWAGTGVNVH